MVKISGNHTVLETCTLVHDGWSFRDAVNVSVNKLIINNNLVLFFSAWSIVTVKFLCFCLSNVLDRPSNQSFPSVSLCVC